MLLAPDVRCKMKNYLITITTVSVCIGIYNVIAPHFKGLEKYTKMIGMVIVLCVVISPMRDLMDAIDEGWLENIKGDIIDIEDEENGYDEMFKEYLNGFSIDEIKREIKDILLKKFEIPDDECEVSVKTEYKNGSLTLSHVQILLSGGSVFKNPYQIEDYFKVLLGCECQVLIK